jgi:CDP-glycerol glycerophosphotransferase (TagB/SpsB family)
MRTFVDEHDDCFLAFRPHPYLVGALRRAGIMDDNEFRAMFTGDRCWLYDGPDYWSLFRWSNALVSDASSFLVEYAPTRNPIVYLQRDDGHGGLDDSIEAEVTGSCYTARTPDDVRSLLLELKSGRDPMRGERARFQERMSVGMFSGGAGERVAGYLARTLG